ncbi:MAG: Gfo/Idh/MocA family oxidoreductase [Verrucomicrobiota bacterium]
MNKVKVAVIGVGHMGTNHARVYSEIKNAELVGVYDINKDVCRKIAQLHGVRGFGSLEEAMEAADAVSVVTPTTHHFEVGSKCLEAGKHVLIEKPFTSDTKQAMRLVEIAEKNEVILQVGHVERFNPVLTALEERLTHPMFIESHRLSPYPGRSTDIGVVMDMMIHDIEIILHLVKSPIQSIDAVGISVLSKGEDIANARLRFKSGCVANITTSRISQDKMRKIRVFQDNAYLSLDYQKQSGEIYRKNGAQIKRESIPVLKDEPLKKQLESFLDCVQTKSEPVVSGAHASAALKVAAKIVEEISKIPLPQQHAIHAH